MRTMSEAEIRQVTDMASVISSVEKAFIALAQGRARQPDAIYVDFTEANGETHVKGAHLIGSEYFVIKVASGFYDNPKLGLPVGSGLSMVFNATTGVPAAVLIDNGYLTDMRTGAAGAIAYKHLAPSKVERIAMIGAGLEARFQLRALATLGNLPEVVVWSRTTETARRFAAEMESELGASVTVALDIESAIAGAQVITTVTPSREPLIKADWIKKGTHITALGSDGPNKQELDVRILANADLVVCDWFPGCAAKGEIHHAIQSGVLVEDGVYAELGEIVGGTKPGRANDQQVTVCDLTGVGVQDAAAAAVALTNAGSRSGIS
jgi:alanine dehydrogenase